MECVDACVRFLSGIMAVLKQSRENDSENYTEEGFYSKNHYINKLPILTKKAYILRLPIFNFKIHIFVEVSKLASLFFLSVCPFFCPADCNTQVFFFFFSLGVFCVPGRAQGLRRWSVRCV